MFHRVERMRIKAIGERIVQEPVGSAEDREIVRVFEPQALQRAEIVHIAQFVPQLVHDLPITRANTIAMRGSQPFPEVIPKSVVVEERIVDVEQKDGVSGCIHSVSPLANGPSRPVRSVPHRGRGPPGQVGALISGAPARSAEHGKRLHAIDPGDEARPEWSMLLNEDQSRER